jgi:MFS family permease
MYLPVLALSFIAMLPAILIAEKKQKMKPILLMAIALLGLAELLLWQFHQNIFSVGVNLFLFFGAFSLLEAMLPSLATKFSPANGKGTAMGVYSTCQFFGIFLGGTLAGLLLSWRHQTSDIFLFCGALALIWLAIASSMKKPKHFKLQLLNIESLDAEQLKLLKRKLTEINGVKESELIVDDGIAYLKIDTTMVDHSTLTKMVDDLRNTSVE